MEAARLVVQALTEGGVRQVVVAPGSRSAPLAYALAEAEAAGQLELHVRIDERVAGFTALGLASGSLRPAAVLTTSGTAVGNLLPAVMEANHSAIPLVVISADRPEELRGTGANQTTVQMDLFGDHVRFATDIAAGRDPRRAVGTALSAAQGRLQGTPSGPVQLNLAFRDPLTPPLTAPQEATQAAPTQAAPTQAAPTQAAAKPRVDAAAAGSGTRDGAPADTAADSAVDGALTATPVPRIETGTFRRTVVLAGSGADTAAAAFAEALDLPLLAEPSSNARFGPNAVGPYRLLLEHFGPGSDRPIERVVVFGRPTLSRPVAALLARTDLERALYLPRPVAWFEAGRRSELVLTDWSDLTAFAGNGPEGWLAAWQQAAAAAEQALDGVLSVVPGLTGVQLAREVWARSQWNLVLGSSNPIRDVDLAGRPLPAPASRVFANRGLAGIDGTISSATGIALATRRPARVLLGDLTFLHDAGGLLLGAGEREPDLQVVVLNDAGGGIFSTLEHGALAAQPRYTVTVERLFGTPHAADIGGLAAAYGARHRLVEGVQELRAALEEPIRGRSVLEVPALRKDLRPLHTQIRTAVSDAVARTLG
ncbi:MAG: 2-succinyl-5-enolpyruvyl-6-hydroxy-3-cyclohexene-carboxylate synthase [Micrococcaceae bacterium]|nr:2-succinyl-5-enolpyruvyl-6-hydroxy-3-cyclohexene-carboxylate synthase [Micrococcaceae bacterium]